MLLARDVQEVAITQPKQTKNEYKRRSILSMKRPTHTILMALATVANMKIKPNSPWVKLNSLRNSPPKTEI